ncbi:MAG: DUF294 nucleotidyltransferase-like domain-containing protein, partial [Candidatus Rokuibacteriota bacterium]
DRDLRRKVVAAARDPAITSAADIMSTPLVTTRSAAFAFEALLEMTRHDIHHLVVLDEGRLTGVVSSTDVLVLQTTHPVTLGREIGRALSLDALATLAARVTALVGRLVDEGGTAYDIGQIVAELNDRLVVRVLALAAGELEEAGEPAPPVPFCWLTFGSEARREQTLRTDQDNGLVYADPPAELAEGVAAYYTRFAAAAIRGLVTIGFPPCPGDVMASNPRWCRPLSAWERYFRRCMTEPTPEQILAASIHFDVRPLVGALELGERLSGLLRREAPSQRLFLALLARDVVGRRPALTVFGRIAVEGRGPREGRVDVKGGGGMQLVGAARLHALELGVAESNTIDRFRAAGAHGIYGEAQTREITDACQLLMRLRLAHQLEQLARGQTPDNEVTPARLSHADALLLRDALATVRRVQSVVSGRFPRGVT